MTGTTRNFLLRRGGAADWPAVRALLLDAGLPVADLSAEAMPQFTVAAMRPRSDPGTLAGVIALQPVSDIGLLRSLAVAQQVRSSGCGKRLVQAVEQQAVSAGMRQLWLLTTGAALYFETLGFRSVPRDLVPQGIRQTAEFASLCPDSAVVMSKELQS